MSRSQSKTSKPRERKATRRYYTKPDKIVPGGLFTMFPSETPLMYEERLKAARFRSLAKKKLRDASSAPLNTESLQSSVSPAPQFESNNADQSQPDVQLQMRHMSSESSSSQNPIRSERAELVQSSKLPNNSLTFESPSSEQPDTLPHIESIKDQNRQSSNNSVPIVNLSLSETPTDLIKLPCPTSTYSNVPQVNLSDLPSISANESSSPIACSDTPSSPVRSGTASSPCSAQTDSDVPSSPLFSDAVAPSSPVITEIASSPPSIEDSLSILQANTASSSSLTSTLLNETVKCE